MIRIFKRFSTALREPARREIEKISKADIMIGIPSYNNADSIKYVVETVAKGLHIYYPDLRSVIFVSDGGSTDDTREVVQEAEIPSKNITKLVSIYRGIPGKGSALRAIFEASKFLKVKATALFDADLRSITPEWVKSVLSPVFEGYDFVAPDYKRFKFDGTITNTIAYNLVRALYGYRIRQPIGGDFGLSYNLIHSYLDDDVWETPVAKFGVDSWMTIFAIVNGFRICQARLGAKIHDEKDPAADLSDMFRQVVGTIFMLMEDYENYWKKIKGSVSVPTFGEYVEEEPPPFEIDFKALIEYFKLGFKNFAGVWERILEPEDFKVIESLSTAKACDFNLPTDSWVRIVYRFAAAFHKTPRQKFKLLNMMIPLYNARVATIVYKLQDKDTAAAENYFEKQAQRFEDLKPYLIEIWDKGG